MEDILPENTHFDNFEVEHDFPDIGKRIMLLNARRIPQLPTKAQIILLAIEDITERREIESVRRLATVVTDSNDAITIQDFEGNITAWNRGAEKMYGWSETEALKMNICDIVPEDKKEEALRLVKTIEEEEDKSFETQRVTKDRGILDTWLTVTKLVDDTGKPIAVATTERDITERKKTEEDKERLLHILNDRMKELNCLYSLSSLIEIPELLLEVIFKGAVALLPPAWQYPDIACARIIFENKEFKTSNFKVTKWKQSADIDIRGKKVGVIEVYYLQEKPQDYEGPFSREERNLINAVAERLVKIVEFKKAERELRRVNKELKKLDQLKSDFVSTVSHEIRTPLSITKEGVSLILDGVAGKLNEKQENVLKMSRDNIDRLARITNDILDISKIETGKMQLDKVLVDFSEIIKASHLTWKAEAQKKNQDLQVSLPDSPVNIYADYDKATQIFTNLISNAIKYTPQRGKIKIELKDKKEYAQVSISDTGIGIAKEDLPKVFSKFQQFSRTAGPGGKGTGLGLAIVKQLVEMHKGIITVESKLDKGSKFTLSFPKIDVKDIFKEYINNGIKQAADRKACLSLMVMHIEKFDEILKKVGYEKAHNLLKDIEKVTKGSLRRRADSVVRDTGDLIVLLFDTPKENVSAVKVRIEEALKSYLAESKEGWIKTLRITFGNATYPDEAANDGELLNKAKAISST